MLVGGASSRNGHLEFFVRLSFFDHVHWNKRVVRALKVVLRWEDRVDIVLP